MILFYLMIPKMMNNEGFEHKAPDEPTSFSFFRAPAVGKTPCFECMPGFIYKYLRSDYAKLRTMVFRKDAANGSKTLQQRLDDEFDFVTFAGVFHRKMEAGLVRPSCLVCFHFKDIQNVEASKTFILSNLLEQTVLLFTDVYGTGLNWVTRNDTDMAHCDFFRKVDRELYYKYDLDADARGKLMSDAVYLPFDDEVYINPDYIQAECDVATDNRWSHVLQLSENYIK